MQTAVRPSPRRLAGRAALAFAAAASTLFPSARAAVYTWTGQRGSGSWTDASLAVSGFTFTYTTNWGVSNSGYVFPPSSASTSLVFGATAGATTLNQNLANPFVLNSLTFASGANGYTIGGGPLAFSANGGTNPSLVNNATAAQTITAPAVVKDNLSVVATAGDVTLAGQLTGTGGIYKFGTGSLVLTGGTTASPSSLPFLHVAAGPATISGGVLNLTATGSTGWGGESSLFVESDSSLVIENGAQVTASATPQVHNNGLLYVVGAGTSLHVVDAPGGAGADLRVGYAGGTSYLDVLNGAALTVDRDVHLGNSGYAANPGRGILGVDGGSSVTIAHTLTLDGATDSILSIVDGTVSVGALASAGSSTPRIYITNPSAGAGGVALTVGTDNSDSLFAGLIHGSGTLKKVGTGTLTLSGQSDYTGGTQLAGGTIRLAADNALPVGGDVTLSSATLDLNNHNQTLGNISVTGPSAAISIGDTGTLTLGGDISTSNSVSSPTPFVISGHAIDLGGVTRNFQPGNSYIKSGSGFLFDMAIAAPITGTGGVRFAGGFTLLAAPSSYTGATTIDGTSTILGVANALPATTDLALTNGAALYFDPFADLVIGGVHVTPGGHDQTVASLAGSSGTTVLLGNATLTVSSDTANTTFAGTLLGGGGKLVKAGAGTLALTTPGGANSYTGGTTIAGGVLAVDSDGALGGPAGPLTFAGGFLRTLAGITSARPVAVTAPSYLDTNAFASTFTGAFSGTDALTVYNGGSLTLSGATGTLGALSTYYYLPASITLDHSTLTTTTTGTTGWSGYSSLFADVGSVITLQNGTHLTTTGFPQVHNTGSIVVDGPATVWTNNDPGGGNLGEIRVGYAGHTSTLAVRNGATVNTSQLKLGDAYLASNPGTASVTLSGGSHVNVAGLLWLMNGSSLAVDRASLTAGYIWDFQPDGLPLSSISLTDPAGAPGTALVLNNTGQYGTFSGPVTDGPNGPGGITVNGAGWHDLRNATYSGPTTVNGGALALYNNVHTGSFTANTGGTVFFYHATVNPGTKSLTANGTGAIYYDTTTVNGGFFRGTGTHIFQNTTPSYVNASTFLPGSNVINGGNVTLTNVTSSATITNYGPLTWDGGYNTAAGTLHVFHDASTDFFENDGAITVYNTATLSNSQSNLVSGGGSSVTVNAGGTINLNATALELHAATLVNNGAISGGPTLVYANSTAKGSGTFGPVSLLSGGTFSPGNSPGSATTGSALWSSGGHYLFELTHATGTPGTDWDLWNITGDLTLAATPADPFFLDISPFNLPDFNPAASYDWLLAAVTGSVTNFDPASIVLRPEGVCLCDGTYSLTQTGGDIILHYNPVPEPTTLSLLFLPAAATLLRRRRRDR